MTGLWFLRHPASSSIPQAVTLPVRGNDGRYSASPATIRQRRKQDEVTAELQRAEEKVAHPTQKWLPLLERIVCSIVPEGGSCLDPFMGSGTTGVAAVKHGRRFTGIEVNPDYFDIACRRVEAALREPSMFIAPPKPAEQLILLDGAA